MRLCRTLIWYAGKDRNGKSKFTFQSSILLLSYPSRLQAGRRMSRPKTVKSLGKIMVKPHRKLKKANHGQRAANSKARKAKRRKVRT